MYYPYGATRWTSGALPTDRRFTGQQWEGGIGLYDYNARWYHPVLGRFVSADTIVPSPGDPQTLNRYAYTLNNPLRFTDPTGHYSEEEIMEALGVTTWDEVLALFCPDGDLEGLWGWLEILRQANDMDWVMGRNGGYNGGRIMRSSSGITVDGLSHIQFATRNDFYSLDSCLHGGYHFSTRAETIHYHLDFVWEGAPNWDEALNDARGIGFDIVGGLALANVEGGYVSIGIAAVAYGMGVMLDIKSFTEGLVTVASYDKTGRFNSRDVFGIVGVVPWVGGWTDYGSLICNLFGLRVDVTP